MAFHRRTPGLAALTGDSLSGAPSQVRPLGSSLSARRSLVSLGDLGDLRGDRHPGTAQQRRAGDDHGDEPDERNEHSEEATENHTDHHGSEPADDGEDEQGRRRGRLAFTLAARADTLRARLPDLKLPLDLVEHTLFVLRQRHRSMFAQKAGWREQRTISRRLKQSAESRMGGTDDNQPSPEAERRNPAGGNRGPSAVA